MITNMKVLVLGAGNAGRPAARLLRHLGNSVLVNDVRELDELPPKARKRIDEMKDEGVRFRFGGHRIEDMLWADAVFVSPSIPPDAPVRDMLGSVEKDLIHITTSDIGRVLNQLIGIPMVGVAGTDGKTTTTNMIDHILSSRHRTVSFSSIQDSLVIEGLVELVVNGDVNSRDMAVFELPHGTIRMADGLEIVAGVVTNLTPDHMDEFRDYDEYIERNFSIKNLIAPGGVLVLCGDDPVIAGLLDDLEVKSVVYGLGNGRTVEFMDRTFSGSAEPQVSASDIDLRGLEGSEFTLKVSEIPTALCSTCGSLNCAEHEGVVHAGPLTERIKLRVPGLFNVENALAAITVALVLGFDIKDIKNAIEEFRGIKGRFEFIDRVEGVPVYMDAAHNPESMEKLFEGIEFKGRLIISLDNPDTLTVRDKYRIGQILGEKADVLIVSGKNETTGKIDMEAASEVERGAGRGKTIKTDSVYDSIRRALEIAEKGDTVLHLGPGVVNAYDNVRDDIERAIESMRDFTVVLGGCGNVGSLMARNLRARGYRVVVSDLKESTPLEDVFRGEGIELDLGGHSMEVLRGASTIAITPALENNRRVLDLIRDLNADVIGVEDVLNMCPVDKPVVGVTGTNGKTTTTGILKSIMRAAGKTVPEHHLNIQGNTELVPALQARLPGDVAVVEIGTFGRMGEIRQSALLSGVSVGVITNISRDHLSGGRRFSDYIECKREIIDTAEVLVLNADDPIVASFAEELREERAVLYGIQSMESSQVMPEGRECPRCGNPLRYTRRTMGHLGDYLCVCGYRRPQPEVMALEASATGFKLVIGSEMRDVKLRAPGIFNVYNALAAAAAAWSLGVNMDDIVRGIESFGGVRGRFQRLMDSPRVILDYAHNPAGVRAVMQELKGTGGRLIVVNTVASESGIDGDLEIASLLKDADTVIPASYAARRASDILGKRVVHIESSRKRAGSGTLGANREQVEEAVNKALEIAEPDDTVLIIGEGGFRYAEDYIS
ncbi:MAG: Mur ligase family protein [Methanothermobacter sp.]|uniref:Mur ligase family protein n=2 Tax=Methanothermobacter sp. TaxID=1884223 RepID=UPI003C718BC6